MASAVETRRWTTAAWLKRCRGCEEFKPRREFGGYPKNGVTYVRARCPSCEKDRHRVHREANRERRNQRSRESYKVNKARRNAATYRWTLKQRYGMTWGEYLKLLERQRGVCAICKRGPGNRTHFDVDHDHQTGRIRGLLCNPCNLAVGKMENDPRRFERAASYLMRGGV